jgi:hypothetical protein
MPAISALLVSLNYRWNRKFKKSSATEAVDQKKIFCSQLEGKNTSPPSDLWSFSRKSRY